MASRIGRFSNLDVGNGDYHSLNAYGTTIATPSDKANQGSQQQPNADVSQAVVGYCGKRDQESGYRATPARCEHDGERPENSSQIDTADGRDYPHAVEMKQAQNDRWGN